MKTTNISFNQANNVSNNVDCNNESNVDGKLPWEVTSIIPFAAWLDKHPALENILLWIMGTALAYAVWTYDFTTNI